MVLHTPYDGHKDSHSKSLSLCVGGTRGYTVSTQDMLMSTAPVLARFE